MTVLGCGPSGANWDGKGFCIGVNDCLKFGKPVQALVCVNSNFEPDRFKIIRETVAKEGFYSQLQFWAGHPDFKRIHTEQFRQKVDVKTIYHSKTSPFIAISLAANMGHKEIVLYGVDFDNHPIVKGEVLAQEVDNYIKFIRLLRLRGINVYLGENYGALKGFMPVKSIFA
jgi:hypothetical protein